MSEKVNPWLDEGKRFDKDENGDRKKIRDMKFKDNATHTVRIVHSKDGEFPFYGYKQHWIPQNGSLVGKPITHGIDERCAVCEWVSIQWNEIHRLKEEEDMTDKSPEVAALLKKVSPVGAKTQYDMNVFHREDMKIKNEETGEEEIAPKRMRAVNGVYKEIFNYAKKWGSPSNDETGYDLEIKTSGAKEKREYSVVPERDSSPLTKEEKKALEKCYNLADLRKPSTREDIRAALENAKSPYDEILKFLPAEDEQAEEKPAKKSSKSKEEKSIPVDTAEDVEKEIAEETGNKEQPKSESKEDVKDEKQEETLTDSDENNIEAYECKGDFDENDEMCTGCPVEESCKSAHPFYVKAKTLKIDTDPHRTTTEVIAEVKKAEAPQESAPKRGKRIPF